MFSCHCLARNLQGYPLSNLNPPHSPPVFQGLLESAHLPWPASSLLFPTGTWVYSQADGVASCHRAPTHSAILLISNPLDFSLHHLSAHFLPTSKFFLRFRTLLKFVLLLYEFFTISFIHSWSVYWAWISKVFVV